MLSTMALTGPFNLEYAMAFWRRITAPTLIVHGAESGEFWRSKPGAIYLEPDDLARRLACFRDARFVEIPGAGHMVHFDRPRELLAAGARLPRRELNRAGTRVDGARPSRLRPRAIGGSVHAGLDVGVDAGAEAVAVHDAAARGTSTRCAR